MKIKNIILYILLATAFSLAFANNVDEIFKNHKAMIKNVGVYTLPNNIKAQKASVKIQADIDINGNASNFKIVSQEFNLGNKALKIAKGYKFIPANKNGRPTNSTFVFEINFYPKEITKAVTTQDTVKFNPVTLKANVYKFNDGFNKKKYLNDVDYFYSVNNHLLGIGYKNNVYFRRGFYLHNTPFQSGQIANCYSYFDSLTYTNNSYTFNKYKYSYPVMFSSATLGSGSYDMKTANFSVFQGELFKVKNLNFSFGFASKDGLWLATNQKSSDVNIDLSYKNKYGKFSFNHTNLSHDFSNLTLKDAFFGNSKKTVMLKSSENTFNYSYKFLNLGVKSLNQEFNIYKSKKTKSKQVQYLAAINKSIFYNDFYFSYIYNNAKNNLYSNNDTTFTKHIFTANHNLNKFDFNIKQQFISGALQQLYYNVKASYKTINYLNTGIYFNYTKFDKDFNYKLSNSQKIGFLLKPNINNFDVDFIIGKLKQNGSHTFVQVDKNIYYDFAGYSLSLGGKVSYVDYKKVQYLPKFQAKSILKLTKDIGHDNTLFAGLKIFSTSNYYQENNYFIKKATVFDAFIGFTITKKFMLKADFVNLTDEFTALEQDILPQHVNFGFRWNFVN